MIHIIKATTQLKQGILDPEGSTIQKTLVQMGYPVLHDYSAELVE